MMREFREEPNSLRVYPGSSKILVAVISTGMTTSVHVHVGSCFFTGEVGTGVERTKMAKMPPQRNLDENIEDFGGTELLWHKRPIEK